MPPLFSLLLSLALFAAVLAGAAGDAALVARALDRGGRLLRGLVERLMPVVRARVRRRLGGWSPAVREDAVQEVWLALLADDGKALRTFDPDQGRTLEGFVGMVAERQIIDWVRRQQAARRGGGATFTDDRALERRAAIEPDPEHAVLTADLIAAFGRHLEATLPEIGLLVFRLMYTDRLAPTAAAEALGVKRQVVYNWQHRIRGEVRSFLAAQGAAAG